MNSSLRFLCVERNSQSWGEATVLFNAEDAEFAKDSQRK